MKNNFFRSYHKILLVAWFVVGCTAVFSTTPSVTPASSELFPADQVQNFLIPYSAEEKLLIQSDLDTLRVLCFRGISPSGNDQPIYVATAGGPGAGKSTILEKYLRKRENFVYIDPDQRALRLMVNTYLQEFTNEKASQKNVRSRNDWNRLLYESYKKWRPASNYIARTLLNEAFSKASNIAHGTPSTGEHIEGLYKTLKARGYKIILLLCYSTDENRFKSVEHRVRNQSLVQADPEDVINKGKAFSQRFPIYFQYADEIELYWTDNFLEGAILSASLKKGQPLVIQDEQAFAKFNKQYEKDGKDKKLQNFSKLIEGYTGQMPKFKGP